ncbi:glycosyltransferase family 9 protein [Ursidibacter maritimus]|uniref:Glycosyltransferase family 9 protein n=1 Tax=Ursidibacter maritimus TaxID=1331689 RepID=A0A949T229_9PAST|nr:glycosyltransferase family 9 protein [Ursidibacter maritimus]KAE9539053.1 glycosyl transferase [Ursidibacter maritimus]MBV6524683.1 glycosyltransferase family 9 protein [Ursidibacter maritimus]MBV6526715.1 glycosyltransferase family 9 protein [Ursidibacter maritimus]MBV6527986.1 glycosyltransferase family 9 protein [Ursidibacter maritimus]MBV6530162.1 glycosyltransferase family 9 protein [Ursidibacter maritimus]
MRTVKSICVLRLSAIGDVCHTLAVVQAIQRQYPHAEITWILGKAEATLMAGIPNVTLVTYDKKTGWKGIWALWRQLRRKRFDYLLNLQTAFRASMLSLGIKANVKIGFNRDRAREGQWLFTNLKVEQTASPHVLDGQMMFAKAIGVTDLSTQWYLPISEQDRQYSQQFIEPQKKNVVIAPCSSKKEKDWLPERYAEIANFLLEHNINVIICGSSSTYEIESATKIHQLAPKTLNIAGITSLKQLASVIQQADLVISSDSGPAHIATTQHTPIIGLYAIHNPLRTGPYNDLDKVVSVYDEAILQEYGKSWQDLPWATRAKGKDLMSRISVEQVKQKIVETFNITL